MRTMRRLSAISGLVVVLLSGSAGMGGCGGTASPANGDQPTVVVTPGYSPVIKYLEDALDVLGFFPDTVDGVMNSGEMEALKAFQHAKGLAETGQLDAETLEVMEAASPETQIYLLEALQTELADLGYFRGDVTGSWTEDFTAAIVAFQTDSQIEPSGKLTDTTLTRLNARWETEVLRPALAASGVRVVEKASDGPTDSGSGGSKGAGPGPSDGTAGTAAPDLLRPGDESSRVKELQTRLAALGFRPGQADGRYGPATASAVMAFEKHEGLERDGIAGPKTLARLAAPKGKGPRSTKGPRIEVDLDRQIAFIVARDGTISIINISSGSGQTYHVPGGGTDVAYTPTGNFSVIRRIDGPYRAPLGTLYRPLYFYEGWAVHGSPEVPAYPASHGCVRTANWDQDYIFPTIPDGAPVIIYGRSLGNPNGSGAGS